MSGGMDDAVIRLIEEIVSEADLDPAAYLCVNADVAEAGAGDPAFARQHYLSCGSREGRGQLCMTAMPEIAEAKSRKLANLADRLTTATLSPFTTEFFGVPITMLRVVGDARLPVPFNRISSHNYDDETTALVDGDQSHLFLEIGAGLRPIYRSNVVYTDIAALPSTDVLCFGDGLPFEGGSFDGAIGLAVLEHVPDPFAVAAELMRVVRPGGQIVIDWPFLQPLHGYPDHFFNATESGARRTFEDLGGEVKSYVPPWLHPVFTLHWFLSEWLQGLPEETRGEFLRLTTGEILSNLPMELLRRPWAQMLAENRKTVISAGNRLWITR